MRGSSRQEERAREQKTNTCSLSTGKDYLSYSQNLSQHRSCSIACSEIRHFYHFYAFLMNLYDACGFKRKEGIKTDVYS